MSESKWYILHTYSGYENKVANDIKTLADNRNLQNLIADVMVPIGPATDEVTGKPILDIEGNQNEEKLFPCYVYVKMVMTDETWYICRNTRGVTGFVGPGSKPVPLSDGEMKPLGIKTENVFINFTEGDTVNVIAGVWKDTVGVVQRMDMGKQTATIMVELFGRETPVEISFDEINKANY